MTGRRLDDIMARRDRSPAAAAARFALAALEPAYRAAVAVRNATFDFGLRKPRPAAQKVISVGNITAGGTGKTPMVMDLVRRVVLLGHRPAVVLRGYKGSARGNARPNSGGGSGGGGEVSDEAAELASRLASDVPIITNPDRHAAAHRLTTDCPHIDVLILDDAFQHRQIARDLDLVLIDATVPFGHGRMLPRGLLREPPSSLARADAVIITRADLVTADELATLDHTIESITARPPIAHTAHQWTAWRSTGSAAPPAADQSFDLTALKNQPVLAVSAIGNPGAFAAAVHTHIAPNTPIITYPDHHRYTPADLHQIFDHAQSAAATAIVTTEKDWVKWQIHLDTASPLPIYRPALNIQFLDGGEALSQLLQKAAT